MPDPVSSEQMKEMEAGLSASIPAFLEDVQASRSTTESKFFGVSMRGWLALVLVGTMCILSAFGKPIPDELSAAVLVALGFYFGQKIK